MNDVKRTIRDTEANAKEALRRADGEESLEDKIANAGDRLSNAIKNAGDELEESVDEARRDVASEHGRADEMADEASDRR